jgi:hypothetical protein
VTLLTLGQPRHDLPNGSSREVLSSLFAAKDGLPIDLTELLIGLTNLRVILLLAIGPVRPRTC